MPDDFLEDLQQDIDELEESLREHEASKGTHVAAGQAIEASIDAGLDAVRRECPRRSVLMAQLAMVLPMAAKPDVFGLGEGPVAAVREECAPSLESAGRL